MTTREMVRPVTLVLEEIPEELNATLQELHCSNCGRFLALQAIVEGTIAVRCRRCKQYTVLDVQGIGVIESE